MVLNKNKPVEILAFKDIFSIKILIDLLKRVKELSLLELDLWPA